MSEERTYFTKESWGNDYTTAGYRDYLEELVKGGWLSALHDESERIRKEIGTALEDSEIDRRMEEYWCEELFRFETPEDKRNFIEFVASRRMPPQNSGDAEIASKILIDGYKGTLKFIEEFLQNADDCEYENESPEITISIDEDNACMEFAYNERGFECRDILAITAVGESSKPGTANDNRKRKDLFYLEKTGRKGFGFRSVFALQEDMKAENIIVHIQSNGYSFRFDRKISTQVPIWEKPIVKGSSKTHIRIELINPEDSWKGIYEKTKKFFCADETKNFFAECPMLYMHQLKKVKIEKMKGGVAGEHFDIAYICDHSNITYSSEKWDIEEEKAQVRSGIVDTEGQYCRWQTQKAKIQVRVKCSETEELTETEVFRYTRMVKEKNGEYRNYSMMAPILREKSKTENGFSFVGGGLFCTFPVSQHEYSMPIAIDAPFELNAVRDELLPTEDKNAELEKRIFGDDNNREDSLFAIFLKELCKEKNVRMDYYFQGKARLFNQWSNRSNSKLKSVDLGNIAETIALFRSAGRKHFISYKEAVILSRECYEWPYPERLVSCMFKKEEKASCLISKEYTSEDRFWKKKMETSRGRILQNKEDCINLYLEAMEDPEYRLTTEQWKRFLPCLYELSWDDEKILRDLKIFGFDVYERNEDGSYAVKFLRESGEELKEKILIRGGRDQVDPKKYGFYNFRLLWHSTLEDINWEKMEENTVFYSVYQEIPTIGDATGEPKIFECADNWEDAKALIKACFYYGQFAKIDYLWNCVLEEEYDERKYVLRDGYHSLPEDEKEDSGIKHIIGTEDLREINQIAGKESLQAVANDMKDKELGLLTSDTIYDYSDPNKLLSGVFCSIKAYCTDRKKAEEMLGEIRRIHNARKDQSVLTAEPDDLDGCHPAVFEIFFRDREGFVSEEAIKNIAEDLCENYPKDPEENDGYDWDGEDGRAAYLRALSYVEEPESFLSDPWELELNFIKKYKLFDTINKLNYGRKLISVCVNGQDAKEKGKELEESYRRVTSKLAEKKEIDHYSFYTLKLGKGKFLFDTETLYLDEGSLDESRNHFIEYFCGNGNEKIKLRMEILDMQQDKKADKQAYIKKLNEYRQKEKEKNEIIYANIKGMTGTGTDYIIPELLQNINDCKCRPGNAKDDKRIILTISFSSDADEPREMILDYDEYGFTYENVDAITGYRESSKTGENAGEKGIGFKRVFTLFQEVKIYSNGFFFRLTKDGLTLPEWVEVGPEEQDKYGKPGRTRMIFSINPEDKSSVETLGEIKEQWESIAQGNYGGEKYSPIFLENIRIITCDWTEKTYDRDEMLEQYFACDIKMFDEKRSKKSESLERYREHVLSRAKCSYFSEAEKKKYFENITFQLLLPKDCSGLKKRDEMIWDGMIFSAMPVITKSTNSFVYINVPFELIDGRDELTMDYKDTCNRALCERLFAEMPENGKGKTLLPIFFRGVEELVTKNDLFFPEYLSYENGAGTLLNVIAKLPYYKKNSEENSSRIKRAFCEMKLFRSFSGGEFFSLAEGYFVPEILYRYVYLTSDREEEIRKKGEALHAWMVQNDPELGQYRLIALPMGGDTKKYYEALCGFARMLDAAADSETEDRYPYDDPFPTYVLKYFHAEYGEESTYDESSESEKDRFFLTVLQEYSGVKIIDKIISVMKEEMPYSPEWWRHFGDILKVVEKAVEFDPNIIDKFKGALKPVKGNEFLFYEFDDKELRDYLVAEGIFYDLGPKGGNPVQEDSSEESDLAQKKFWKRADPAIAGELLTTVMGVADHFTENNRLCGALEKLWADIPSDHYPVGEDQEEEYKRCEMIAKIMTNYIKKDNEKIFFDNIDNMVWKNVNGEYVPLAWHLFYGNKVDEFPRECVTKIPGLRVRSNAEIRIAEALWDAKIPFVYEKPLYPYLPDFTIVLPNGEELYWEHFGMMHNAAYRRKTEEKEAWYQDNHKILLTTYQGGEDPFDDEIIKSKIQEIKRIKGEKCPKKEWKTYHEVQPQPSATRSNREEDCFEKYHLSVAPDYAGQVKELHDFNGEWEISTLEELGEELSEREGRDKLSFYRWMWNYSHQYKLAYVLLKTLSERESERESIIRYAEEREVLSYPEVLLRYKNLLDNNDELWPDNGITIAFSAKEALRESRLLNKLSREKETFSGINCVVDESESERFEITEKMREKLISAGVPNKYEDAKQRLDNVYVLREDTAPVSDPNGKKIYYVKCLVKSGEETKEALILNLAANEDEECRLSVLSQYLREETDGIREEEIYGCDWKEEYEYLAGELIKVCGIREKENRSADAWEDLYPGMKSQKIIECLEKMLKDMQQKEE